MKYEQQYMVINLLFFIIYLSIDINRYQYFIDTFLCTRTPDHMSIMYRYDVFEYIILSILNTRTK